MHYNIGRGETELRLIKLTSELHHLHSESMAVVCVSTPRMYTQSGYFLVSYKLDMAHCITTMNI